MPAESLSFRCRPHLNVPFMGLLMFGVGAAVLGWIAHTNDRGLVLNGGIRFNVEGATFFYWVMAGLFALVVLLIVGIVLITLLHGVPDIVLTAESISFPLGFPVKRAFALPLSEIKKIRVFKVSGQRLMEMQTAARTHGIALNWLESKEAAEHLTDVLNERWSAMQDGPEYAGVFDV
ncbi:MAG: hypothetical protein NTY98_02840 [Verrucomicrobia bacterium]|nr:hypothetical protein [Verrucomicrobiota bacterium]